MFHSRIPSPTAETMAVRLRAASTEARRPIPVAGEWSNRLRSLQKINGLRFSFVSRFDNPSATRTAFYGRPCAYGEPLSQIFPYLGQLLCRIRFTGNWEALSANGILVLAGHPGVNPRSPAGLALRFFWPIPAAPLRASGAGLQ